MQLTLVSGLSGSGKSIALKVLEDSGYYCVDNLPATLLLEVVDFLAEAGHDRAAVSVDARSAAVAALPENIAKLRSRGVDCRVLYLEANSPTLLRRFSETRRRHPLAGSGLTLSEAIGRERTLLAGVAALAHRIDTSELQPRVLQNWIRDMLGVGAESLTLLFESFAYRDGIPLDADWVLDARMLPNPHYDPQLRPYTGKDAVVIEYLARDEFVQRWLADVGALLGRWLPEIVRENRSYVTVAIGCTGGRHRSVYLAERL
ncbi:MAG TPA: RNase adapter RapZ, partial [Steroidobacteraceae bacterium]